MKDLDKLTLNRDKKILAGVCAGLADHFDLPIIAVRILFIIATFTWALTILVYLVLFLTMNRRPLNFEEISSQIKDNKMAQHFQNLNYNKTLYKNRRKGVLQGVCAGIAEYFEIPVFFVRLAALGALFFGPFVVLAYIIAAIVLDNKPKDYLGRMRDWKDKYHSEDGRRNKNRGRRQPREKSAEYGEDPEYFDERHTKTNFGNMDQRFQKMEMQN